MHDPTYQRRVAGAGLAQKGKPGGGVLAGGDDLNRYQTGEGDQGDKTQQIAHQFAMGKYRIADDATGAWQSCAQFAINNAEQQNGQAADKPGVNARRAGNGGDVAGGK
ncbi:hypothetical protein D3C79_599400 [compost metagenome]